MIDEGCLPERPTPYDQANTSWLVTSSGVLWVRPKKSLSDVTSLANRFRDAGFEAPAQSGRAPNC